MLSSFDSRETQASVDTVLMSHLCDPRNRPGYDVGDPSDYLLELPAGVPAVVTDELRTVLLAWFSAALIVAVVASLVLVAQ